MFSTHHVDRSGLALAGLVTATVLLFAAGGVGMAYVAGFANVHHVMANVHPWWLVASAGAVMVAFAGYMLAYHGIQVAEDGPKLELSALLAVVTAGFGGLLAHGGTALDEYAMRAGGADPRAAKTRVSALAGSSTACWR